MRLRKRDKLAFLQADSRWLALPRAIPLRAGSRIASRTCCAFANGSSPEQTAQIPRADLCFERAVAAWRKQGQAVDWIVALRFAGGQSKHRAASMLVDWRSCSSCAGARP